jgi:hypothetical protein
LAVESIGDKYSIYDMHKAFLFKSFDIPRPENYNQDIDKAYRAKTVPIVWPYTTDPDWK